MKIKKINFKVDKCILVTKEVLISLVDHYNYPKEIENKMNDLIKYLEENIDNKNNFDNYEVQSYELYEEVMLKKI